MSSSGDRIDTVLEQISIGGCFAAWDENIFAGDHFRLEIELPNRNRLPLQCKAIYRFEDAGIGFTFTDISRFEQELIASIISSRLEEQGLPGSIDPFARPDRRTEEDPTVLVSDTRRSREAILDEIMSGNNV